MTPLPNPPSIYFCPFDSVQLPLKPLEVVSGDWANLTGGDSIMGGWLDGLTDESEEGEREREKWRNHSSNHGSSEDAARTVFASTSEHKVRWRVEVRQPNVVLERQQHAAQA